MYQLRVRALAQQDIQHAVDYYEEHAPHVVDRFLSIVYAELENIQSNPLLFQKHYQNKQVAFIKGFPFGIHFLVEDDIIHVLAVLHTSRDPKIGKSRL